MKKTKNEITDKEPMNLWLMNNEEKFEQKHLVRADKIVFINNHLMFYLGKNLIFKVWLKDSKWQKYKNIEEALKDTGFKIT